METATPAIRHGEDCAGQKDAEFEVERPVAYPHQGLAQLVPAQLAATCRTP